MMVRERVDHARHLSPASDGYLVISPPPFYVWVSADFTHLFSRETRHIHHRRIPRVIVSDILLSKNGEFGIESRDFQFLILSYTILNDIKKKNNSRHSYSRFSQKPQPSYLTFFEPY